jgi:hypothetical protein
MRALLFAVGTTALCIMSSPGIAADMAVPRQKETMVPTRAPAVEAACLRWVEQNYSWYNYCDPVPYYGRQKYNQFGEFF